MRYATDRGEAILAGHYPDALIMAVTLAHDHWVRRATGAVWRDIQAITWWQVKSKDRASRLTGRGRLRKRVLKYVKRPILPMIIYFMLCKTQAGSRVVP